MSFNIGGHRRFGDVWTLRIPMRREGFVVTCRPDHLKSLLKASPGDAPSLTGEREMYAVIRARRLSSCAGRDDVLSLLLQARDGDGELLTDHELRNELMSLVLAGHETTANSLAWAFERLLRNAHAYRELRDRVRGTGGALTWRPSTSLPKARGCAT